VIERLFGMKNFRGRLAREVRWGIQPRKSPVNWLFKPNFLSVLIEPGADACAVENMENGRGQFGVVRV
jgi:hypothetical protein